MCVNSILLVNCIVQKPRLVVAQTFFLESPLDISEEAQGILKHHLFSSVAFPGGKDNKKVACARREEHGRSHREEGADR